MSDRKNMRWDEAAMRQFQARNGRWTSGTHDGGVVVDTDQPGKADSGPQRAVGAPAAASTGPVYALVRLCRDAGLPEPVPELRFHALRRWRFDYAWPLHKLALEVEGGIWTQGRHTRGSGALADLDKYSEAAIAGWRVIYCTPGDLSTTGMDRVRRALNPMKEAA